MMASSAAKPQPRVLAEPRRDRAIGVALTDRRITLSALWPRLFAPVDAASIGVFRFAFGALLLWEVFRYVQYGWIANYYIDPVYNFPYIGFSWVKPWAGNGMYYHFGGLALLSVLMMFGIWYRVTSVLLFLTFTYIFLLEKAHYLNHFYLISLISFILIFVPANRAFALPFRRHKARVGPPQTVPTWALWLLRAQLTIVYVYGGLSKFNGDWLRGEPMRMWLRNKTDFPIIGRWFTDEWMVYAFSYGGLLFDLTIAPLLLWSRTRPYAFVAALLFHLTNNELFHIGIFPWMALAATVLFFPPSLPRRLSGGVKPAVNKSRRRNRRVVEPVPAAFAFQPGQRAVVALLALFLAVQVLIPQRHHLYSGNVAWTEEGSRFSWRMKLRAKGGSIALFMTDSATQITTQIDPDPYLTGRQTAQIATHPDMLVQFSHYLEGQFRQQGYGDVEIRAQAMVSLNGREPQLMVDPEVDLTVIHLGPGHVDRVLPLTTPLRTGD